jgi:hypothetical protein
VTDWPLTVTGEAMRLNGRGWSTSMVLTALAPVASQPFV